MQGEMKGGEVDARENLLCHHLPGIYDINKEQLLEILRALTKVPSVCYSET